MAYSFPLSLADFYDTLPIEKCSFFPPAAAIHSETRGGDVLTALVGASLWRGSITLGSCNDRRAEGILGMIAALLETGGTFLAYPFTTSAPALDPRGLNLGSATPSIKALPSNRFEISLKGLPVGYTLKRGDAFGFSYGSNPIRRALHRVTSLSVAANGSGDTATFNVVPAIKVGAAISAPVTLLKPSIKAKIVPGSVREGSSDKDHQTSGISFNFVQSLG